MLSFFMNRCMTSKAEVAITATKKRQKLKYSPLGHSSECRTFSSCYASKAKLSATKQGKLSRDSNDCLVYLQKLGSNSNYSNVHLYLVKSYVREIIDIWDF